MLTHEQWRFAIEDARARHEAILTLIYATDRQAMSMLSLYVTLGLATASVFVASIDPSQCPRRRPSRPG
jgi:hypothetical protein